MLGIGSTELALIFFVLLIFLGPKDLAKVAKTFGDFMGKLNSAYLKFRRELNMKLLETEDVRPLDQIDNVKLKLEQKLSKFEKKDD